MDQEKERPNYYVDVLPGLIEVSLIQQVYTELLRDKWSSIQEAFDAYCYPNGSGYLEILGWHGIYTTDDFIAKCPGMLLDMLGELLQGSYGQVSF